MSDTEPVGHDELSESDREKVAAAAKLLWEVLEHLSAGPVALKLTTALTNLTPDDPRAWEHLALDLSRVAGENQATEEEITARIRQSLVDPSDGVGFSNAAGCARQLGDTARAGALSELYGAVEEVSLAAGIEHDDWFVPNDEIAWAYQAAAEDYMSLGWNRRARVMIDKALRYAPDDDELPELLAQLVAREG